MNKNLLLTLLLFCCTSLVFAQSYSVEPLPATATASLQDDPADPDTPNPGDVVAHAEVVNSSAQMLNMTWIRTEYILPDGWKTGVCDLNTCYGTEVNRESFTLEPGGKGTLDVHLYPGGEPGSLANGAKPGLATILVSLSNSNIADDTLTARFEFEITGTEIFPVSTSDIELSKLRLFPNPADDYFELTPADNEIEEVVIFNILGRQVKQFDASERRFDISDLTEGIYLASLMGDKNQVLKTMRLQKR